MTKPIQNEWIDLKIPAGQLRPDLTLAMGQCFNWKRLHATGNSSPLSAFSTPKKALNGSNQVESSPVHRQKDIELTEASSLWVGVIDSYAVGIRQTPDTTLYTILNHDGSSQKRDFAAENIMIRKYFQLDDDLNALYSQWNEGCDRMKKVTLSLPGVRVVRQTPYECLVSFICSSNNNIKRITLMLDSIKKIYGNYIITVVHVPYEDEIPRNCKILYSLPEQGGTWVIVRDRPGNDNSYSIDLYTFPAPIKLAEASEEELRGLGMGYRAKFISGSSKYVHENGNW